MVESGIEIKGLEEFQEKLRTIEKKAPDRILKKLDEQGNYLRKKTRENIPRVTGKLRGGVSLTKSEKHGKGYRKGMYNRAPHHHLVNNGHKKVTKTGRVIGWTPGLFYIEATIAQHEGIIMSELQGWLDELYAELK